MIRAVNQSMRKDHQRKTQKHHTLVFVYSTLNNVKPYSLHDVITLYMIDSHIDFFSSPGDTFTLDQLRNKLVGKILHKSVSISYLTVLISDYPHKKKKTEKSSQFVRNPSATRTQNIPCGID